MGLRGSTAPTKLNSELDSSMTLAEQIEALDRALTCAEVAQLLGIHRATAWRLAITGKIRYFRINTCIRVHSRELAAYLRTVLH